MRSRAIGASGNEVAELRECGAWRDANALIEEEIGELLPTRPRDPPWDTGEEAAAPHDHFGDGDGPGGDQGDK